jgi:hypothetical protein
MGAIGGCPLRIALHKRPGRGRLLLGSLYLLATLVAGLVHVRDCCATVEALAGCDDPGAHWAAHNAAPDLSAEHDHLCSLCGGRAVHEPWAVAGPERPGVLGRIESEATPPARPRGRCAAHPTRGPPELG